MRGLCVLVLVLTATAGGCSSSESPGPPPDPLRGKWIGATSAGSGNCTPGLVFNGNLYEVDLICQLNDGSLGIEAVVGNYTVAGNVISLTPTAASCRDGREHGPATVSFTVDGRSLRVVWPSGLVVLEKLADDPNAIGSGAATTTAAFGCVNPDRFVPGSVEPL